MNMFLSAIGIIIVSIFIVLALLAPTRAVDFAVFLGSRVAEIGVAVGDRAAEAENDRALGLRVAATAALWRWFL